MSNIEKAKRTPTSIATAMKPNLVDVLPKHIDPDNFLATVQSALHGNPKLMEATSRSLYLACLKAATDGLLLDGREAALILRNVKIKDGGQDRWENQATYQPMVQGLRKLAMNSGKVVSIVAHVVYDGDQFAYVLGDEERVEHVPAPLGEDRGKPIGAYAIVKLTDGSVIREVMRASEILSIGAQGYNAVQYDPVKGKNFGEWWRKTVIRRVTKYLPRSTDEIGRFAQAAERIDGEYGGDPEPEPERKPIKKRGAAAAAMADVDADVIEAEVADHDPDTGEVRDMGVDPGDPGPQPGDDI